MQNVRSLKNKFHEIETLPKTENNPDIIALTETWLNPTNENLYQIANYEAIYNSRTSRGGGIVLYVKQNINYKILLNKTINSVEILTILLKVPNLTITLLYKPPQINLETLESVLQNNIISNKRQHIIMGDININIATKDSTTKKYETIFREKNYKILNKRLQKYYTRKIQIRTTPY